MGTIYRRAGDLTWQAHPEAPGLMMKALLELPAEGITARLHKIPLEGIPEHAHERRHVIWVLSGSGRLWVEDQGDLDLAPGSFVYIPSGLSHRFYDIAGGLELYTISLSPEEARQP